MQTTDAAGRLPLPLELHSATRTEHTNLNRTIISRLPLCLPSATSGPALYAQGMAVIGQIYYGIEEAWDVLLSGSDLNQEQRQILTELDIPQLRRSKRLDASIDEMTKTCAHSIHPQLISLISATRHFREDIKRSILAKPHLIMAYTWTMYLALFNGGRFIAKQLLTAGTIFWNQEARAAVVNGPLSFWFFGDEEDYDGEDVKIAFKERFHAVAELLTRQERDEIIAESKKIFQICAEMVEFLDKHAKESDLDKVVSVGDSACASPVGTRTLDYLVSLNPIHTLSRWRSVVNGFIFPQSAIPVPLRQGIEQKQ